jgi:hypothetical protein
MATEIEADEVEFNPSIIAAAWEAFSNGIPAVAAEAILNQFYDYEVPANAGMESDRDVYFPDRDVMVEEKAIGVCAKETAEEHAGSFIDLGREDGKVLALNGAAVCENWAVPA